MKTTRTDLTVADILAGYEDDRYLGWGYLNARSGEDAEIVATADAIVLEIANAAGWSAEELFAWLNSKLGRWFGDEIFGGAPDGLEAAVERALRHHLFDLTEIV